MSRPRTTAGLRPRRRRSRREASARHLAVCCWIALPYNVQRPADTVQRPADNVQRPAHTVHGPRTTRNGPRTPCNGPRTPYTARAHRTRPADNVHGPRTLYNGPPTTYTARAQRTPAPVHSRIARCRTQLPTALRARRSTARRKDGRARGRKSPTVTESARSMPRV